jgi:hypothetical protein
VRRVIQQNEWRRIKAAFARNSLIDADNVRIKVTTNWGKITVKVNVDSWFETRPCRRDSLVTPDLTQVEDHLTIMCWRGRGLAVSRGSNYLLERGGNARDV